MSHPKPAVDISIAHCLEVISKGGVRNPNRCPGFLVAPLQEGSRTCSEAGGKLVASSSSNVWELDVNGDSKKEFTFEYEGNVDCEGAWSIFSCGSLGCPATIYELDKGAWRSIGQVQADSMESIEILDARKGQRYRDLRVGCAGENPCAEYWFYNWKGAQYDCERLEVRGFGVAFANSMHGLYKLAGNTALLATPKSDGAVIEHYGSDTEVAMIGTAEKADYYYVSPCNACQSGFVAKAAVVVPAH